MWSFNLKRFHTIGINQLTLSVWYREYHTGSITSHDFFLMPNFGWPDKSFVCQAGLGWEKIHNDPIGRQACRVGYIISVAWGEEGGGGGRLKEYGVRFWSKQTRISHKWIDSVDLKKNDWNLMKYKRDEIWNKAKSYYFMYNYYYIV